MTFFSGCMMALSAVIGLRITVSGSSKSMMTTWFCSFTFSRTQMNLSLSSVSVLNPMLPAPIPNACNYFE